MTGDVRTLVATAAEKLSMGDLDSAAAQCQKALHLAPRETNALLILAAVLDRQGKPDEAMDKVRTAARLDPGDAELTRWAAKFAEQQRDHASAGHLLNTLSLIGQASSRELLKCALNFVLARRFDDAAAAIARAEHAEPTSPFLHAVKVEWASAQARWRDMAAFAQNWMRSAPNLPQAREAYARALFEGGDIEGAVEAFKPLIDGVKTPTPDQAQTYARICLNAQKYDEAQRYLDMALAAAPDAPDTLVAKARLLTFQGRFENAEALCRRAIALDPRHVRAFLQLAIITRGRLDDETLNLMTTLWEGNALRPDMKAALAFALGETYARRKDAKRALAYFDDGNALRWRQANAEGFAFDATQSQSDLDLLARSAKRLARLSLPQLESPSPKMIFVMGLPRSGTTLVESILAAHPDVHGGGELTGGSYLYDAFIKALREHGAQDVENLVKEHADAWRSLYLSRTPAIGEASHLTDKLPGNALIAPLLGALFPDATFLFCRRSHYDVGVSIYRHQFPRGYPWSHRLEDIAVYFGQFERAMAKISVAMGERLTQIFHGDLVANPDRGKRAVVAAAGLDWAEECDAFEQADRTVATFSSVQVRSGISKSASSGGDLFRSLLTHFQSQLDGALIR